MILRIPTSVICVGWIISFLSSMWWFKKQLFLLWHHCTKPSNMPICVRIQQCTMWVEFWSLNLQSFIQRPHGYTSVCNSWPPLQLFSVQPIWLFCSGIHTFHLFWLVKDTLCRSAPVPPLLKTASLCRFPHVSHYLAPLSLKSHP